MLKVQAKDFDIVRLSKLIVKYNINATITDTQITLNGEVSEDLLEEICKCVNINTIQNFSGEKESKKQSTAKLQVGYHKTNILCNDEVYDLIYPTVKRGEVYLCDFGEPYNNEVAFLRPAIVIQNDIINEISQKTIVLPCTSKKDNHNIKTHMPIDFGNADVFEHIDNSSALHLSIMRAEQIKVVSQKRLRKLLGVLNPEIMDKIQNKIEFALGLNN